MGLGLQYKNKVTLHKKASKNVCSSGCNMRSWLLSYLCRTGLCVKMLFMVRDYRDHVSILENPLTQALACFHGYRVLGWQGEVGWGE